LQYEKAAGTATLPLGSVPLAAISLGLTGLDPTLKC